MKFLKNMGLLLLGLILFATSYIYYLSVQRDSSTWTESIEIAKNIIIPIEFTASQRKYYGGHAFGWGGGDVKNSLKFQYANTSFYNKNPYIPVVIRFYDNIFYIIYFDRETYLRETTFKFYRSIKTGDFKEIEPSEFPKHLAIQNRWFKGYDSDPNDLVGLDPKKVTGTMTSQIWYMIEGKENKFTHNTPVHLDFIKQYKEKYITNRQED